MSAPIVFMDIAGENSEELKLFYSELFDWQIGDDGQFNTAVLSPTESQPMLMGAVRQDPSEKVFYIGVKDVTKKLSAIEARGGIIDQPRFEVPGVVVLGLFKDPAGNRMGLVELENGKLKIP